MKLHEFQVELITQDDDVNHSELRGLIYDAIVEALQKANIDQEELEVHEFSDGECGDDIDEEGEE